MNIADINQLLAQHPFFSDLAPDYRSLIAGCGINEHFHAGAYIFREGGPADRFYLIRHGSVALEIHLPGREPLVVDTLHAGDILGWSWLLPPYAWHSDARAVQLTRAIGLDAACLRGKMEGDHELGYELYRRFMPVIARRLQAGRLQLADIYGVPGTGT